jgi:hypothetical protein
MPPVIQIRVKLKSGQIYVEVNNPNLVSYVYRCWVRTGRLVWYLMNVLNEIISVEVGTDC